jgi:hypothetical protein
LLRAIRWRRFFTNDMRAKVAKKNKDARMTDISKLLGDMWRNLSEASRGKYLKMAAEDKVRYASEKAAHDEKQRSAQKREAPEDSEGPEPFDLDALAEAAGILQVGLARIVASEREVPTLLKNPV